MSDAPQRVGITYCIHAHDTARLEFVPVTHLLEFDSMRREAHWLHERMRKSLPSGVYGELKRLMNESDENDS